MQQEPTQCSFLVRLKKSTAKRNDFRVSPATAVRRAYAGMARAKAKGIKVGRPRLGIELRQKIAQRAAKGETAYAIAKSLGIDRHTVAKYAS
jgi:DNA-binding NarL/FixJ family response regulator